MNCDPNSLSIASSCLRCIPDGMIPAVKISLLCSWANAKIITPLLAPTDAQWTWVDAGGGQATAAVVGGSCPVGADGFQLGAVASPGDPTVNIIGVAACNASISHTFNFGDTALAVIRWTLGGVPKSNWSAQKSVVLSNGLLNGLVAYWKLDEAGNPPTFADATGNGWTGTNNGITTVAGKINNALNVVNNTDGVSVSSLIDTRASNTPFFISFWFFNNGVNQLGQAIGFEWGTRSDYILFSASGTDVATFRASDDGGTTTDVSALLIFGSWSHVVMGFDGSKIYLYVNTVATSANKAAVRRGGGNFILGNYQTLSFVWPGKIDEMAYYNRTLSANDVSTLYNSGNALPFGSFTL